MIRVAQGEAGVIIVEVKNEMLGDSEFWRGDESHISQIRNIPARMTAEQVVRDGRPRTCGMWHVRQEMPSPIRLTGSRHDDWT